MIIRRMLSHPNGQRVGHRPFDFYTPVTPLVFCTFKDDGYGHWHGAEGLEQRDVLRFSLVGLEKFNDDLIEIICGEPYTLNWDELPDDHFPWFIRRDVFDDLLPTLEFEDWCDQSIVRSKLDTMERRARESVQKRLKAAVDLRAIWGEPFSNEKDLIDYLGTPGRRERVDEAMRFCAELRSENSS